MSKAEGASAVGIATVDRDGNWLDGWFPAPRLTTDATARDVVRLAPEQALERLGQEAAAMIVADEVRDVTRVAVEVTIQDLQAPVADLLDAYLRLHLLSHRLVRPRSISFDGFFDVLRHDVAWTTLGACRTNDVPIVKLRAERSGSPFSVRGIFPVPPMLDYVWPSQVTIADASRVMLGAYLAPGTMVTQEGFCASNAGTLGPCMVEGRVTFGVTVGGHSHVGGGASLMGTLSGGGREIVSLGERCLLGANAGVGIALGDDCVVEAGCYITAGAPVRLADGTIVKARELSGKRGILFRRNAQSGALEAIDNAARHHGLNPHLHKH